MAKILVTGNKGYIGAVLCKKLLDNNFEVIGLDTGFYDGCEFSQGGYSIKQIFKDVRDVVKDDLLGMDAVVHLAALSNDPMGALNPRLTSQINHFASVRLAQLAKQSFVKKFIFSSSCSVYGVAGDEMISETGALNPATEYAKSKVMAEAEISKLADHSFSPIFLRNATVYGASPMLRLDLVVNNLVGWAYTTGKIRVMSDGSPWRPLIHIEDICSAFIAVLRAPREIIHNQVFNVGSNSENYCVKDIAETIRSIMPECRIEYSGEHGPDARTYRVDFSKFNRTLSAYFDPVWDIEKGVRELYNAYKENNLNHQEFGSEKFIRLKQIERLMRDGSLNVNLFWENNK